MAVVPFTFANKVGQIPLSELDVNFANVKAFAETAGNITGNIQSNITAVGTLTSLTVSGNITAPVFLGNVVGNVVGNVTGNLIGNVTGNLIGNVTGNISGNLVVSGANTQVLFNDNGVANATAGLTFNKASNLLSVPSGSINTGTISATGIIVGNVLLAAAGNIGVPVGVTIANIVNNRADTVNFAGRASNVFIANVNSTTSVAGNLTAGGSISATANVVGGNLITSGLISATSTITSGSNIVGSNLITSGLISATSTITSGSNIVGSNLITFGQVSATGNIVGANFLTVGNVSLTGNLTASGNAALSGNATAPTAANGTNTTQIATTAFVTNAITNAALPAGVILLWSGSIASIPTGWALCNGANGTPDLRDRFVVGAGSTYAVAATGGSANAVVVSHTHTATSNVADPGHAHGYVTYASFQPQQGFTTNCWVGTANTTTTSNTTGITVSTTVSTEGVSGTGANLPPYYALAYIMKL